MTGASPDATHGVARPLVLGVGNRFRGDDGVGPAVLDALAGRRAAVAAADLRELDGEPTRLLDAWAGRRRVVVVDAVRSDPAAPDGAAGRLVVLAGADAVDPERVARWRAGVSGHSAGLAEAIRLAAVLGRLPEELCIVGVEVAGADEGPGLSPAVAAAVGAAADEVCRRVGAREAGDGDGVGPGAQLAGHRAAGGADVPR